MKTVPVELKQHPYEILIGNNILKDIGSFLQKKRNVCTCAIITNPTVNKLYGSSVKDSLSAHGFSPVIIVVPDSETSKSIHIVEQLYKKLVHHNLNRESCIIALGGGVIGDLAGFVASTYMRGIDLIQVPTTLLAQVDSAMGGKVAVDIAEGKNLVGSFYHPILVVSDISTLTTLPENEIRSGLAEVIKYGIIADNQLFNTIDAQIQSIFNRNTHILIDIVHQCSLIKTSVVLEDEREQGLRAILNYGHTLGHALETITKYQGYSHGEAISIGMIYAARISLALNKLSHHDYQKLEKILIKAGLPTNIPSSFEIQDLISIMKHDKKIRGKNLRFILPKTIGEVFITETIPDGIIENELGKMIQ